jgi:hypothetical protein
LNARGFTSRSLYFLPPQSDFIPLGIAAVSGPDAAQIVVSAPRHLASEAELAELCAVLVAGVSDGDVAKRAGQVSDAAQTTPLR